MIGNAARNRSPHEALITALAIGGFFIILGLVISLTPNITERTNVFWSDITTHTYPLEGSSSLILLAPAHPDEHNTFYTALMNFLLGVGILQIVILALRFWMKSPIGRIAETVGNLIFWLGAAVIANIFLLVGTLMGWFQFWSALIILIGVSLVARFFVYLAKKH